MRTWKIAAIASVACWLNQAAAQQPAQAQPRPTLVAQVGHAGFVNALAVSPDNKCLATASADKTAKLWELSTGRELRSFNGHTGPVKCVMFSCDSRWLATGSEDKTIRIWEAATGRLIHVLQGHVGAVTGVAFLGEPTEKIFWLASASADGTARLWDLRPGRVIGIFEGHSAAVTSLAFSADGGRLFTGSADQTVRIWDIRSGNEIGVLRGHEGSALALALSQDGKWLATGGSDKTARLWDISDWTSGREQAPPRAASPVRVFAGHTFAVNCLAISADGQWLATGSGDCQAMLWELSSGKAVRTFEGHTGFINGLALTGDNKWLLTASADRTVRLWDLGTGKTAYIYQKSVDPVYGIFVEEGKELCVVIGSEERQKVRRFIWDLSSGKQSVAQEGARKGMQAMAQCNGRLITSTGEAQVRVWGAKGKELCRLVIFHDGSWAVFDNAGRFDAAKDGNVNGLHWVIGTQSFPLGQFRERFYDRGLLQKYLGFDSRDLANVQPAPTQR